MPIDNKLVLPVVLGLSLVSVTAFVVYYVFKRDEEETGRKTVKSSRVNVIEVNVSKSIVPALIGRSGSNIKEIERKSGAMIHFKKFTDKEYDVCIIRGRSETTQLAETMIHDFIKQQPLFEEDELSVPGWAVGRIIGTGGENINEISHRSGARVKIDSLAIGDKSTQRKVKIRGTTEQIKVAKDLITNCVSQEKCRREIEQAKRSPRHHLATAEELPGEASAHTHAKYKRPENTGSSIEVYVSAVSSPSRFWVQFVGNQVAQLDELVTLMTDYYGSKDNREMHALNTVSVGQLVAAVFRHDGRWYRARVQDITPNEFDATQQVADVFFVDYGDSEYVATHELCELRADLLRLRFQAMECFLAGVRPASSDPDVTDTGHKWSSQAVERFEELTQVARWKPLVSRTCTYKKTATSDDEKDKEIPGIKLFDVTEDGELDIGAALISEGLAHPAASTPSPRPSPPPPAAKPPPFGDLGSSMVLGMLSDSERCSSLPKDLKNDIDHVTQSLDNAANGTQEKDKMTTSKSLGSGLERSTNIETHETKSKLNGSHENFLHNERQNLDKESNENTPILSKSTRDEFKANMNRIDSHHGNLEALGRSQH